MGKENRKKNSEENIFTEESKTKRRDWKQRQYEMKW
jgi:hypothetical protein